MEEFFSIEFEKPYGSDCYPLIHANLIGSKIAIRHEGRSIVGRVWSYGWLPDKGVDHIGCRAIKNEIEDQPRKSLQL